LIRACASDAQSGGVGLSIESSPHLGLNEGSDGQRGTL
jgi:hypothetical protein